MADSQRKTANLFDVSTQTVRAFVRAGNITAEKPLGNIEAAAGYNLSAYIAVIPNTIYTIKYPVTSVVGGAGLVYYSDNNGTTISGIPLGDQGQTYTFTTPNNCNYIRFSYDNTQGIDVMLNTGNTALPYEPYGWLHSLRKLHNATDTITTLPADLYADGTNATVGLVGNMSQTGTPTPQNPIQLSECGDLETTGEHTGQYKIPILSGGQTTPVYLGEVESTRRIQKVVFTGGADETWNGDSLDNKMRYYPTPMITNGVPLTEAISTHFAFGGFNANSGANGTITGTNSSSAYRMYFWSSDYVTVDAWKAYLAQQYAAGTPVTVWYVLATETTGIVNEPIRKIGTYADTVSGISIPTITGKDTFDVQTTLKPSEVELTYTGWHDASAKEWDGSEWQ